MHVAVLGAGVVGMSTAYYLVRNGHTVTVIDRASGVACATSFANGSQLCYSFTDAMASPRFAVQIPGLLVGSDPTVLVRPDFDFGLVGWGAAFLRECTDRKAERNTVALLSLALRSSALLKELRRNEAVEFAFRKAGKLVLLDTDGEIENARRACDLKMRHGCETRVVDIAEAVAIDPAVGYMSGNFSAAVYSPNDEIGDARAFSESLATLLRQSERCEFKLGISIQRIKTEKRRFRAVETSEGSVHADVAIVCLGSWSPSVLKPLGIHSGIYPVRGYSVTLPVGPRAPSASVTDLGNRFVMSRNGGTMRIAGFADFVGYSGKRDAQRLDDLMRLARKVAPEVADYDAGDRNGWGGIRPLRVSGRPLTGPTPIDGLFLNTGHGSLGWTLACVTAHDVARLVAGSGTSVSAAVAT